MYHMYLIVDMYAKLALDMRAKQWEEGGLGKREVDGKWMGGRGPFINLGNKLFP